MDSDMWHSRWNKGLDVVEWSVWVDLTHNACKQCMSYYDKVWGKANSG